MNILFAHGVVEHTEKTEAAVHSMPAIVVTGLAILIIGVIVFALLSDKPAQQEQEDES